MTNCLANVGFNRPGRPAFLRTIGVGAISLAFADTRFAAEGKPLRGLFPYRRDALHAR